jgi:glycosyltransferase involved in cell wall biosynthesis
VKILLVGDYANLAGGAEHQMDMLRAELRRRGHEVRVFTSRARSGSGPDFADDVCFGTTSRFRTLLQSFNPWAYLGLRRVLGRYRPDVVHVCMFLTQLSPTILPLLRDTPSLFYAVWYRPVCPTGTKLRPDGRECDVDWGRVCHASRCVPLRDWLPLMMQMNAWRRRQDSFDRVVANSNATAERLRDGGIEASDVVWPGVLPRPLGRPLSTVPTVVCAARLVREKGVDVLVDAFAELAGEFPDARLTVAGDGPERSALVRRVESRDLDGRVTFLGRVSPVELQRRFSGAWVQVVPSRWAEPFGMVAAEGMMRGCAVVATDAGGLREIVVDGDTGFLVPPGDVRALSRALRPLLRGPDLADRMGREGRDRALRKFGVEVQADRFLAIYRSLVDGAGG